ncbi:MAG: hybrid sensor histidine kinase/response regulator [gamma proteobacterium symbiont of Phacoides pectinatus]
MHSPAMPLIEDTLATADVAVLDHQDGAAFQTRVEVDGDPELVETFLEEARELIESIERSFASWRDAPGNIEPVASLERALHTLKGGARLSGVPPIGDLSHAFESLLTAVSHGRIEVSPDVLSLSQTVVDGLASQVEQLDGGGSWVNGAEGLVRELEMMISGDMIRSTVDTVEPEPEEVAQDLSGTDDMSPDDAGPGDEQPVAERPPSQPQSAPRAGAVPEVVDRRRSPRRRERVRVQSELLDYLVNNAGEVSIYRARLEQQNGDFRFNVSELEQTISRLNDQLRQLEIETEAQILFRYEKDKEAEQDLALEEAFDPLEFDRFSTMQQLSRSLIETVNDLKNISGELDEQQRETETLLLQQSRLTTDLQDGLMRTRMIPFSQLLPRLTRLVRQTCAPLGKEAELVVRGGQGELDRSILDRMVGPFEHLLRNAVSHGIEDPRERVANGKPEAGVISIDLVREGSDVLITVGDDGRGIPVETIRRKAIDNGMLDPNADVITDNDVLQFVLEHGFSTAEKVTQIAGRGVGLDVVVSEVKQLGGALDIRSEEGRGAWFIIRLPLTLAISDALLVNLGEEVYAISHASIEGVVRASFQELSDCYQGRQPHYSYAGNDYQVRYLGGMLGISHSSLTDTRKWYPMLLVRAGEHRVALQVDEVLGNRQIVVKSVGSQLSTIRWISGGTILGDGRVAIILDVTALVPLDVAHSPHVIELGQRAQALAEEEAAQDIAVGKTVMVVDDSITVRKVTTRLLERHGIHALTAKDGVDAVAALQEQRPDIMLLDIEMPRMDGFELARHMRNTEELKDIPIIMITSRTGDKHRNMALDLGVRRYLGKPYQESDLLENIHSVLAEVLQ